MTTRDKKRIKPFLERLEKVWNSVPNWRFGQLIVNVFSTINADPFFPEDDEMIEYFENYFKDYMEDLEKKGK